MTTAGMIGWLLAAWASGYCSGAALLWYRRFAEKAAQ